MKNLAIVGVILIVIVGLLCATYLAVNDHPWMALFVLLALGGTSASSKGCKCDHDAAAAEPKP